MLKFESDQNRYSHSIQPMTPKVRLASLTPGQKARRTAKWAITMTKWLMTRVSRGTTWQVVAFFGPNGAESRGIVDLVAIRKDHRAPDAPLRRGDLFEIILIQVKGGTAAWPDEDDVEQLRRVAKKYHARCVLLAEWKKGRQPAFHRLRPARNSKQSLGCWELVENTSELFC
jgi:hypothetical protein